MPVWLLLIVLVFGSYRITRLVTKDDFPPVLWMRDRLAGGWRPLTTREWEQLREKEPGTKRPWPTQVIDNVENRYVTRAPWSPWWLADLVSCPWCVSAYVSGVLVTGAALFTGLPDPVFTWFAVWGASALLASKEWA